MVTHQITVSPLIAAFALLLLVIPIQGIQPNDVGSILAAAAAKHDAGPQPTHSGYLDISSKPGSSLYYAFWEASNKTAASSGGQPILLWLQGGPGCASTFGAFYELGPWVTDERGKLVQNPFSFNNNFGLLIIDQPIGTGYSIAGSQGSIPQDMTGMAQDLYEGLWRFFHAHRELQQRPVFITGESYAGKFIPSIAHYILQVESGHVQQNDCRRSRAQRPREQPQAHSSSSQPASEGAPHPLGRSGARHQQQAAVLPWTHLLQQLWSHVAAAKHLLLHRPHQQQPQQPSQQQQQHQSGSSQQRCWTPKHPRPLGQSSIPRPNFQLQGVAIGNGLTDPRPQTRALASVVFNLGLVSEAVQEEISQRTEDVIQLISQGSWEAATSKRSELLDYIQQESGVATLLDVRRSEAYDAGKAVDALLDSPEVRAWMGASNQVSSYSSCSAVVEEVMSADVMRSVLVLVEDILDTLPVLLYQGQFDAQDGVAGTNSWVKRLDWDYIDEFEGQEGQLWYASPGVAAGWRRSASTLTQVMVRNAGHMVPRDQPQAALAMMEQWVGDVLGGDGQQWQQRQRQRRRAKGQQQPSQKQQPHGL